MRPNRAILLAVVLSPLGVWAQEEYKVESLKEGPPEALSAALRGELNGDGYRVVNGKGKAVADFWLRKAVPASGKPAGPQGAVLFPILAEGELLGALRYPAEGGDFRDQPIEPGVYTLRYGLQPVNGDHLGVSTYRDFALLLKAAKDTAPAVVSAKDLETRSAEAAGSSHPAVLMLMPAPEGAPGEPSMVHDEARQTWGAVVPLKLAVKGDSSPATLPIQLIVVGAALN